VKFLCDQCKAKYQIADEKVVGRTVRMKCRKCGHLIEVRAAVTEPPGPASVPPAGPAAPAAPGGPPSAPKPPKPAPARSTALAATLTSARPAAPKPDRLPGALAGAFKTTVQREEEVSAPFDMAEVAPNDDWYVAVNGVPVGPVRVAEIRRKASQGAVKEDSLVWQEGLDEWRPLRSFPELAAIVREAAATGRSSVTPPPPDARGATLHPASGRPISTRPPAPYGSQRSSSMPRATTPGPPPRSNVVAITSRLATAERLSPAPVVASLRSAALLTPAPEARALTAIVPGPSSPPAPNTTSLNATSLNDTSRVSADGAVSVPPEPEAAPRSTPWMAIAMVASAGAFGVTAAIAVFLRPAPAPVPPAAVPAPLATAAPTTPSPVASESPEPLPNAPGPIKAQANASGVRPAPSAPTGRSLDLHGLSQTATVAPGEDPGASGAAGAGGQCLSQGQLLQMIGLHQVAVRRQCWDRNPTIRPSVGITVAMTVGPDGTTQGVSASGDDLAVAKCIENDIRSNWHFGSIGCSQKVSIPFKFVRQ
jgi:predicted Zn finger-like uncharacterized protein